MISYLLGFFFVKINPAVDDNQVLSVNISISFSICIFPYIQATCEAVRSFIDETLGFYLVNVTAAATLCSKTLCSSHGRCQRRDLKSRAYLHLDPSTWKVVVEKRPEGGRNYRVVGHMRAQDAVFLKTQFRCQCYQGRTGKRCTKAVQG